MAPAPKIVKDIVFEIGLSLQIQRTGMQPALRGVSRLVGAEKPHVLIVSPPQVEGQALQLMKAMPCVVRFLHQGQMVGFRSEVLRILSEPTHLIFLRYPDQIEQLSLRGHERLQCSFPGVLRVEQKIGASVPKRGYFGFVIDLAPGGCQFAIPFLNHICPSEEARQIREKTELDERRLYREDKLRMALGVKSKGELDTEFPAPCKGIFEGIQSELRWVRFAPGFVCCGLRFQGENPELEASIEKLQDYQRQFFSSTLPLQQY